MDIKKKLEDKYKEIFDEEYGDGKLYFAPGRVNLIGEHTDYNGGYVFPCSLSFGTYGLAKIRKDRKLRLFSVNFSNKGILESTLDDIEPLQDKEWVSYVRGVIWAFIQNSYSIDYGMDLLIYGDIPNGSGLSSSASLEVLTGVILRDLFKFDNISNIKLALMGQQAENKYIGMNCGIMDQFASSMGKKDCAILLNTSNLDYQYTGINLEDASIIISNTNVKHSLVNSEYNQRRKECKEALEHLQKFSYKDNLCDYSISFLEEHKDGMSDVAYRRAKHAITENKRTLEAVECLQSNDLENFGKLMVQSHISLRDDYEVSCKELDILVDEQLKIEGTYGSRMTGGGFGGCTVSIVKNNAIDSFIENVAKAYKAQVGYKADFYIAQIGVGAGVLQ